MKTRSREKEINEQIRKATEKDPDACGEVSRAYLCGDGVCCSSGQALYWAHERSSILEKRYNEDDTAENGLALVEAILAEADTSFGFMGQSAEKREATGSLYDLALFTAELLMETEESSALRFAAARCHYGLGAFLLSGGEKKEAGEHYETGLKLAYDTDLAPGEDTKEWWELAGMGYEGLGEVCIRAGKGKNAASWYRKSLDMLEMLLMKDGTDAEVKRKAMFGYFRMGDLYFADCAFEQANEWYGKAERLAAEIEETLTDRESLWKLAYYFKKLGQFEESCGNVDRAMEEHRRAAALLERSLDENGPIYQRIVLDLAVEYTRLAALCMQENRREEAEKWDGLCRRLLL